jgi:hypothetical protein
MLHSLEECEKERLEEEKKQQQGQYYGGYDSNSFGFDTSTWGENNVRLNGSSLIEISLLSMIVIGLICVTSLGWL